MFSIEVRAWSEVGLETWVGQLAFFRDIRLATSMSETHGPDHDAVKIVGQVLQVVLQLALVESRESRIETGQTGRRKLEGTTKFDGTRHLYDTVVEKSDKCTLFFSDWLGWFGPLLLKKNPMWVSGGGAFGCETEAFLASAIGLSLGFRV